MVQQYTLQVCQKLAIAASLAATFYCLPLAAQTVQPHSANAQKISIDGTQTVQLKDGRFVNFTGLKFLPEDDQKAILSLMTRMDILKFREWDLQQVDQREAELDVALKLSQEFGVVLDEIFKEMSAPKPATPEQQAINKKRAATIWAALEHPLVGGSKKFSPSTRQIAQQLAKSLEAGENINWADKKMIQSLLDTSK